jgi:Domain of unknown function (DUF4145)
MQDCGAGIVKHGPAMTPTRCGHCGREGTLERVDDVLLSSRKVEYPLGAAVEHAEHERRLYIQKCSICHEPTLTTYHWIDPFSDPEDDLGERTIYPRGHSLNALPQRVAKRYAEMLELLHAPDAFAVRAGRVLEAVCADLGVREGTLQKRLERLAQGALLPAGLAEQALLVKEYRNLGGHDDDMEVTAVDVPLLRGFVESLLEFLYWGPDQLRRATEAFERRRAKHGDK